MVPHMIVLLVYVGLAHTVWEVVLLPVVLDAVVMVSMVLLTVLV